jgi:hypothetical protein
VLSRDQEGFLGQCRSQSQVSHVWQGRPVVTNPNICRNQTKISISSSPFVVVRLPRLFIDLAWANQFVSLL